MQGKHLDAGQYKFVVVEVSLADYPVKGGALSAVGQHIAGFLQPLASHLDRCAGAGLGTDGSIKIDIGDGVVGGGLPDPLQLNARQPMGRMGFGQLGLPLTDRDLEIVGIEAGKQRPRVPSVTTSSCNIPCTRNDRTVVRADFSTPLKVCWRVATSAFRVMTWKVRRCGGCGAADVVASAPQPLNSCRVALPSNVVLKRGGVMRGFL